jgi:hypothetical protein
MFEEFILRLSDEDIRKVILECDNETLAYALTGASDTVKNIIFSNMSDSARRLIKEDIDAYYHIRKEDIEIAEEDISNLIRKLDEQGDISLSDEPIQDITISHDNKAEISEDEGSTLENLKSMLSLKYGSSDEDLRRLIDIMTNLSRLSRREGLLYLEKLSPFIKENFIKKGLSFILNGLEPEMVNDMLNQYKKTLMARMEKKLDIMIEGLTSVQSAENPVVIREKLNLYLIDE